MQLRQRHEPFLARIEALIERGRREGTFRSDLPASWLVTTYYTLVHGAGREVVGAASTRPTPRLLRDLAAAAPWPAAKDLEALGVVGAGRPS